MNKTVAYITVFFGSVVAIVTSAAILPSNLAAGTVLVTILLATFTLIAIGYG